MAGKYMAMLEIMIIFSINRDAISHHYIVHTSLYKIYSIFTATHTKCQNILNSVTLLQLILKHF